jgi:hypothetical protein
MQNGTLAINDALHTAIIPPAWRLQIGTFDEHIGIDLAAFAIEDVRRSTTVDAIISAATRWIALQPTDVRVTPKRTVVTIHGGVGDVTIPVPAPARALCDRTSRTGHHCGARSPPSPQPRVLRLRPGVRGALVERVLAAPIDELGSILATIDGEGVEGAPTRRLDYGARARGSARTCGVDRRSLRDASGSERPERSRDRYPLDARPGDDALAAEGAA